MAFDPVPPRDKIHAVTNCARKLRDGSRPKLVLRCTGLNLVKAWKFSGFFVRKTPKLNPKSSVNCPRSRFHFILSIWLKKTIGYLTIWFEYFQHNHWLLQIQIIYILCIT